MRKQLGRSALLTLSSVGVLICAACTASPLPASVDALSVAGVNLVDDPGMELTAAGFHAQVLTDSAVRSTVAPIHGAASLAVAINAYGNHVWWDKLVSGNASSLAVSGTLRAQTASASTLSFCAAVHYADGAFVEKCATASQVVGTPTAVSATLTLDEGRPLATVHILLQQEGAAATRYSLDDVSAVLSVPAAPGVSANLLADPGFESGASGFAPAVLTDSATRSTTKPITGTGSLRVTINGWGNGVWWSTSVAGSKLGFASGLTVAAKIRGEVTSSSVLRFCAAAYYVGNGNVLKQCAAAPQVAGSVSAITASLALDPGKALDKVAVYLFLDGKGPVSYTLDEASATVSGAVGLAPDMAGGPVADLAGAPAADLGAPPNLVMAGYSAVLTTSGSAVALPVLGDAERPAEVELDPALRVAVPAAQCNRALNVVNPAVTIAYGGSVREIRGYWNGAALPLVDPSGTQLVEEPHSYGSMLGFFKPLLSVAAAPAGAGTLEIRAFDGNHAQVASQSFPSMTVARAPAPVATNVVAALARPRIYLTAPQLARIAGRDVNADPAAKRFWSATTGVGYFLSALNQDPDPTSKTFSNLVWDPEAYIPALALCYQLDKVGSPATATKCATAAHAMVMKIANDYQAGVRSYARDTGYDIRFGLRNLMLAYDWMHDQFSPSELALIAQVGVGWVDWYTNTPGYMSTNPANNYYAGYLQGIALTAVALAGDNVAADRLLTLLRKKLGNEVPILDQRACGGDWPEGWSYGPYTLLEHSLINRLMKDLGEDWGVVFDFLQPVARTLTYQVAPDFSQTTSYGGYAGNLAHKTSPALLAVLSTTTVDGALATRIYNSMIANNNGDFGDSRSDTVYEMIFADATLAANLVGMPLSHAVPGTGRFYSRSSLVDPQAYLVTAENISYQMDHFGYANGDVRLYRGGTCLLCPSAYRGPSFDGEGLTPAFSTWTVNGRSQSVGRNNQILFQTESSSYSTVGMRFESSWSASRYDEGIVDASNPLDYLVREVVHVRPGILVVRDLHRRRHLQDTMAARWHLGPTGAVSNLGAGQYQVGTVRIGTFLPVGVTTTLVPDVDLRGNVIGTLMTETPPASTSAMEMVTVISENASAVSYVGGVLKLSTGQCVTFARGGATLAVCP